MEYRDPWPLGPDRPRAHFSGRRASRGGVAAALSRDARARRQVTDVRQLDLPGPPLHGALAAETGEVFPLSQSRRQHAQGTGAALGAGGGAIVREEKSAPGAG